MSRKNIFAAALCSLAVCVASTSKASVTFSQAELLGMTVSSSSGTFAPTGGTGLTANPLFFDNVAPMAGTAGATGFLGTSSSAVYYGLAASDLATLNAALSGGGQALTVAGYNDNNQTWGVGIWYNAGSGIVSRFTTLTAGTGTTLNLFALPTSVLGAGVAVRNVITQPDLYHASWAGVPEPVSLAVWGGLATLVVSTRRRKALSVR